MDDFCDGCLNFNNLEKIKKRNKVFYICKNCKDDYNNNF